MPITINFDHKSDTKTCHRFEFKEGDTFITLYLKKSQVQEADIDPMKGLTVIINQKEKK